MFVLHSYYYIRKISNPIIYITVIYSRHILLAPDLKISMNHNICDQIWMRQKNNSTYFFAFIVRQLSIT